MRGNALTTSTRWSASYAYRPPLGAVVHRVNGARVGKLCVDKFWRGWAPRGAQPSAAAGAARFLPISEAPRSARYAYASRRPADENSRSATNAWTILTSSTGALARAPHPGV